MTGIGDAKRRGVCKRMHYPGGDPEYGPAEPCRLPKGHKGRHVGKGSSLMPTSRQRLSRMDKAQDRYFDAPWRQVSATTYRGIPVRVMHNPEGRGQVWVVRVRGGHVARGAQRGQAVTAAKHFIDKMLGSRAHHGNRSRKSYLSEFKVERIPLDRGGYDRRGRYYGVGLPLYRVTAEGVETGMRVNGPRELELIVRAPDARHARAEALRRPHHWGGWR